MAVKRAAKNNIVKLDEKIIHDDEARKEVFFTAYANLEVLSKDLEKTIDNGYCFRAGIMMEGDDLEKEINKMKIQIEILNDLFGGKGCKKYWIEESDLNMQTSEEDFYESQNNSDFGVGDDFRVDDNTEIYIRMNQVEDIIYEDDWELER